MGVVASRVPQERPYTRVRRRRVPRISTFLAYGFFALFLLFLFLPIGTVILFSFNEARFPVWPVSGFTLDWYRSAFTNPEWIGAITNSLMVAVGTVLIGVPLGLSGAYLFTRTQVRGKGLWTGVIVAPWIIPHVIVGVAMLSYYQIIGVRTSLATALIAHIVLAVPFTTLVLAAQLQGFDRSLEEAAHNLGASKVRTFFTITLPLMKPGLLAASLFAFLISFDEFLVTFFVIGTHDTTVPIKVYSTFRYAMTPEVHAVATGTTLVSLVLLVVAFSLSRLYRDS